MNIHSGQADILHPLPPGIHYSHRSESLFTSLPERLFTCPGIRSIVGALLIDAEAVYDPRLTNDRLLLGMKGTISEMEVASFRERAQAALLQKAQRGALVRRVAIGYVKGTDDRIEKDPDARVRATIDLIFRKFAELGSVRQVYFWLDQQQIQLPVARGPEDGREIVWLPARYHAVLSVLKNPIYAGAYAYGRSKTMVRLDAGQKQVRRQVQRRREDWAGVDLGSS